MGARWIELDVYVAENELIVFHDDRLERTTNGSGEVIESSLEYLRSLDAGKGQRIPFLTEVFDLVDGKAGINIELKGPGTAPHVALLLSRLLMTTQWNSDNFIVSSYDHAELLEFSEKMPQVRTGVLTSTIPPGYAKFAESLQAWSVHASLGCVNHEFIHDAHRRGKKLFVYTVNHPEDYRRLRELGVDGVFTDFPDRFIDSHELETT
jgi:glycerophosphoryl diester phosphodiesterase